MTAQDQELTQLDARLVERWRQFFRALGVDVEPGNVWRGGNGPTTFRPSFWIPAWQKAVVIYPTAEESRDQFRQRIWAPAIYAQWTFHTVLVIFGEPWPGLYQVTPIFPVDAPGETAPHQVAPYIANETAFGFAPASKRVYLAFAESSEELGKHLKETALWPRDARMFPLDCRPVVINDKLAFQFEGDDPRIRDSQDGIHFVIGLLDGPTLREHATQLAEAYFAAL